MARYPTLLGPKAKVGEPRLPVVDLLDLARRRLRLDLACLGRLDGDLLVVQETSGDPSLFGLAPGSSVRRERGLFGRVLTGAIPPLISDARQDPRTSDTASVRDLDVGAYAASPVLDADGGVYGLVGGLNRGPCPALGPGDSRFLGQLADFLSSYVTALDGAWADRGRSWCRVHDLLDSGGPQIHLQPIVDLSSGQAVAVEALARFAGTARPGPLFAEATLVGLGAELETTAIRRALALLADLPPGVRLEVNAAPSTVTSGLVDLLLSTDAPHRLALEITEHERIGEDHELLGAIQTLRGHGVDIVIDDLGTGHAGLDLLLRIRPDVIKLDRFLVRGMAVDRAHRAVTEGITTIGHGLGARVVAEGIETPAELAAARAAGIDYGQGFLLGVPTPDVRAACLPTPPAAGLRAASRPGAQPRPGRARRPRVRQSRPAVAE
ncbi:EAL domain-containing protein [Pseudofrankia inefficax]|uniref:Diguanylate phosphodiesterase with GAF sensor(S) n=1 Tax=Pseudofrankia inefficax (strain DSM 45817 / CECT 9037 / DDB 130130 / EuI1c) TaxID=298654 RepID=E3JBX9_PSEI1|nr:EAL domain-containing protein [Pseudofrankia inefficax]ADP82289.1 diguanylate phosphodiesterase with GAF sensor(s) [Pseudofrankia inefficax]